MASRKDLVKYGAYIRVITKPNSADWRTVDHEISFMLPPEAEHTDAVFTTAQARASKRWKNCWVHETWRH
jgi:hypothetical protein